MLQFVLSDYYVLTATRMMVLAVFAVGFNLLLGYLGLMSLGHALFFAAGLYAAGLPAYHLGWSVPAAFVLAVLVSGLLALLIGAILLRSIRVSFMIVTLMFAQVGYLASLYFVELTNGQDGLTLPESARSIGLGQTVFSLTNAGVRYNLAFGLLAICLVLLFLYLASARGKLAVAIRENEGRTEMLGFNVMAAKLEVYVLSGTITGAAGAAMLCCSAISALPSPPFSIRSRLFCSRCWVGLARCLGLCSVWC